MPTTKSSNYKPGSNISKVLETENIQLKNSIEINGEEVVLQK